MVDGHRSDHILLEAGYRLFKLGHYPHFYQLHQAAKLDHENEHASDNPPDQCI